MARIPSTLMLALLLAAPVAGRPAETVTAPLPAAAPEAGLPPFLQRARQRAAVYRRAVLKFTCTESIFEEDVDADSGSPNWRREATYRYLLEPGAGQARVAEYRTILARNGVPVREAPAVVQTQTPPPYLWAAILDPDFASLFRFEIIGTEKRGVADTVIVGFEGQLQFQDGSRAAEWSGRLWLDRDLLNPVHLQAEPARQGEALEIRLDKYRRAFRLGGIPLRKRPRAYVLTVDFLVSHPTGLSFPSQAVWRRQIVDVDGERRTERMLQRRFTDYGLFDIATDELIRSLQDRPE